jgi:hypothetical protein
LKVVKVAGVGSKEAMMWGLLLLAVYCICVVGGFCSKIKQDPKKCQLGQELFRAKCVVFHCFVVPVRCCFFLDILFMENITYFEELLPWE